MVSEKYWDKLHLLLHEFVKLERNDVVCIHKPVWNRRWHILCVNYECGDLEVWMENVTEVKYFENNSTHFSLSNPTKRDVVLYLYTHYSEIGIVNIAKVAQCSYTYARNILKKAGVRR